MTLLSVSPVPWIVGLVVFIALLFLFKWARREGREERGEIERDGVPPGKYDSDDNPYGHLFINKEKRKP